jgi:hypothetical protein
LSMRFATDGYSFFYQHAAGLSGVFYFLIGFALLKRLLDAHFSRGIVLSSLTAILLGTNLLYYSTADTVNAHAYTFMLAASLMTLTKRWYDDPGRLPTVLGMGAVAALLVLVRPLNVLVFLWPVAYGLTSVRDVSARWHFIRSHHRAIWGMAAMAFLVLLPQFMIWKYSTGHFIVKAYQHMDSSHFGMPNMVDIFLGIQKGMLPWFPLFLFMYLGLFRMRRTLGELLAPTCIMLIVYPLVIGSYQDWQTAGGFGNRYLVDMTPYAVFSLAAWYAGVRTLRSRIVIGVVSLLCVVWACFLLTLYFRKEISFYGLDGQALFDVFWWRKQAFMEWWHAR